MVFFSLRLLTVILLRCGAGGWLWIFITARIFANPKIGRGEIKCKCKQMQIKKQIKAWYPNKLLCVFDAALLFALISIK